MRRGRAAAGTPRHCIYSGTASTAAPPCGAYLIILSPRTRCPGLTESGSALRTSSSTLAIPAPLHRRHPDGASGLVTPSPPTSAHIVAERRHSAITRYAERSVPGLDTPLLSACRRYATTPEPLPDRASGHVTPHITAILIVAERRHSAVTQYAERSGAQRAGT